MVWADKREHDRALADYSEAIRVDPGNVNAFDNRGNTWKAKGDSDRAIADYGDAIRLDPKYAFGYVNRGSVWRTKRNFDQAIADLSQAIRLDSSYSAAYSHRGLAYEAKGQLAQARAATTTPRSHCRRNTIPANGRWTPPLPTGGAGPQRGRSTGCIDAHAASGDRVALVIGNGAYQNVPRLPNPPNDARAMAGALRDIGFSVVAANDLDRTKMEAIILEFLRKTLSARIALVFYAGHGVSIDGRNYWCRSMPRASAAAPSASSSSTSIGSSPVSTTRRAPTSSCSMPAATTRSPRAATARQREDRGSPPTARWDRAC